MTALELVETLRAKGVELAPAGDRLRFRPGEAVTVEERAALRRHKAEVLALLDATRLGRDYAFPWPDIVPGLGARRVVPFEVCSACGSGTWIMYGAAPLCLGCARGVLAAERVRNNSARALEPGAEE